MKPLKPIKPLSPEQATARADKMNKAQARLGDLRSQLQAKINAQRSKIATL